MKILICSILLFFVTYENLCQVNFIEAQNIPSAFQTAIKLGDLDNDGDIDMVRSKADQTKENEIWLNINGIYYLTSSFGNSSTEDIGLADLDNDGDLDIFAVNASNYNGLTSDNANKVWLNNGDGTFIDSGQNLGYRFSTNINLVDVDGDNDIDAIVANGGNVSRDNKVWLNTGDGTFYENGLLFENKKTLDIVTGDIDNDGDIDFITTGLGNGASENKVWKNDGNGIFLESQILNGIHLTSTHLILDYFDNDNYLDLVLLNSFDTSVIYINNGNGSFNNGTFIMSIPLTNNKVGASSDFDLDGDPDLVVGLLSSSDYNKVLLNDGNGNFTDEFSFYINATNGVAVSDIDNDGDSDIFFQNVNGGNCRFWINSKKSTDIFYDEVNFEIYPNPSNGEFIMELLTNTDENIFLEIVDITSKVILTEEIYDAEKKIVLDLNSYSKGVYLLKIFINGKTKVVKLYKS